MKTLWEIVAVRQNYRGLVDLSMIDIKLNIYSGLICGIFRSYMCKFIRGIQGTVLNRLNISVTNRHIHYEASSGWKVNVFLSENNTSSYVSSCPVTVILAVISFPLLLGGKKSTVLLDSSSRNDILAPYECFSSIFPEKKSYYEMTKHKIIKIWTILSKSYQILQDTRCLRY